MTKPTINSQISLGNILTFVAMTCAAVAIFVTTQAQSASALDAAVQNKAVIGLLETRVRVLENRSAKDSEQLRTLQRDIGEIKDGQREINSLLRQLLQRGRIDQR